MAESPTPWIVVLCPPRSCSTVVTAMLGCHPEIWAFPEFHLLSVSTVGELLAEDDRMTAHPEIPLGYSAGVVRALIDLAGLPMDQSGVDSAVRWLEDRSSWSSRELLDWFEAAICPNTGVIKDTTLGQNPAALWSLRSMVPGVRFLHLTRHPVATLRSQCNAAGIGPSPPSGYAEFVARVLVYHHRYIESFLDQIPTTEWARIRAEEALADPEVLGRFVARMGRRSDPSAVDAMRHPERWRFARPGPTPMEAEGDPHFYDNPRLRPAEAAPRGIPEEWEIGPDLRHDLEALARDLGYDADPTIIP